MVAVTAGNSTSSGVVTQAGMSDVDGGNTGLDHARKGDLHEIVAKLERSLSALELEQDVKEKKGKWDERVRVEARMKPLLKKLNADPYFALKCAKQASAPEVRKNYLKLAKQYHPDKSGSSTLRLFQAIQGAFEELSSDDNNDSSTIKNKKQHNVMCETHAVVPPLVGLRIERSGNAVQVAWEPSALSRSHIVRYQVETSMDGDKLATLVETGTFIRVHPLVVGAVYAFRVRVGVVDRATHLNTWSAFSKPLPFVEQFKAPNIVDARFDSPTTCILKWDMQGCFQIQWRKVKVDGKDAEDEWKATNPPEIIGSQCRKKNIVDETLLQFKIRACNPKTKLSGPWSDVCDLERDTRKHNESTKGADLNRAPQKQKEPATGSNGVKTAATQSRQLIEPQRSKSFTWLKAERERLLDKTGSLQSLQPIFHDKSSSNTTSRVTEHISPFVQRLCQAKLAANTTSTAIDSRYVDLRQEAEAATTRRANESKFIFFNKDENEEENADNNEEEDDDDREEKNDSSSEGSCNSREYDIRSSFKHNRLSNFYDSVMMPKDHRFVYSYADANGANEMTTSSGTVTEDSRSWFWGDKTTTY